MSKNNIKYNKSFFDDDTKIIVETKKNYKQLYKKELKKNKALEQEIKEKDNLIKVLQQEKNKINEELKKYIIKVKNSNAAKNGYQEEQKVADDLNRNEKLKHEFKQFIENDDLGIFEKLNNKSKTDISDLKQTKIQVKKYNKKFCFGQIDRHWVNDIIKEIPNLNKINQYLKDLCELPLKECGKFVDKSKFIKKLNKQNYTEEQLLELLMVLNNNKSEILEFVFLGVNKLDEPKYLCGVEYDNSIRKKIIFYKMIDVIDYLSKFNFKIRKSGTVIELGECFTIQRKGGDGGKKSSNQMQFKFVFTSLDISTKLEYIF